jgi:hypothetical protein
MKEGSGAGFYSPIDSQQLNYHRAAFSDTSGCLIIRFPIEKRLEQRQLEERDMTPAILSQEEKLKAFLATVFVLIMICISWSVEAEEYDQYGGIAQMELYAEATAWKDIEPSVRAKNFVLGFEPPIQAPSMDAPAEPMPAVINDDQGAPVSELAPAPVIVDQGSAPCIGELCNILTPAAGLDLTPQPAPPVVFTDSVLLGCGEGLVFIDYHVDGTPVCVPFSTHQDAENHRHALAENIFNHTFAIDSESRKRGLGPFGLYIWWDDYQFRANVPCENTIWGNGEICFKFPDFKTAAIHWWHASKHLDQLKAYLLYLTGLPSSKACDDLKWGGEPNNQARWKPTSESTGLLTVLLPNNHCSGKTSLISNMRIEDEFGNVLDRGRLRHCGTANNNRLHWNFGSVNNFPAPVFVRYDFEGAERCRRVNNPKADLGR